MEDQLPGENAKIKIGYKSKHISLGSDVDFDVARPSISGTLLSWPGYQMNFEISMSRVTQSNFTVSYKTNEFKLHTNKVNKKLEDAVNLAWTAGNSNTHFGIAT
ncbi:hypothetical protein A6R68_15932, partial [Neotoma lepida]